LHRTRTVASQSPDGWLVELAAGAAYTGGSWPQMHLLTEADLAAGVARVHFFRYSDQGKGFWAKDTLSYEKAEGVWTLELPPALRLDREAPPAAERELSEARRATLTARYRTAAAAVHGTVRFVGFADHRPRPNVGVPELFVPLRLEERRGHGEEGKKDWTTQDLFLRIFRRDDGEATRLVVLGDPGSGKTTLCRFATVVIAGEAPVDGVDVGEEILPLFLPFRDYVRVCREKEDCSLVDFLAEQASAQLQVAASEEFLEKILDNGRAVLLLDGLDEVGSAADRESMRERVQAFCRLYPKVPALVTSRIAGYDDAPLPPAGAGGFVHLVLAPFTDEDLRRFVSHWYAVQEPTDPQARDRGNADLVAALDADPRVRELARNPMLATLIALVHRYEAHLPGERAALYDICVKTLLETWPEARRTTFKEVDARLQRTYLEVLAYRMQKSRTGNDREVTIERKTLVDALVEIVQEREGTATGEEKTRGLVERWVGFLEQGSGLLVEQRPGVFAFFHLSLMEYLAARGMDQAEEVLEDVIAERFGKAAWREVCLLAVGSKATEKAFLDRLFAKLREARGGPSFLLRCLREEA
ncbi:MAG: NACHT domain-containing protein, partial [bacterium]|nr:NACHT domain-containing protein [bacterium]